MESKNDRIKELISNTDNIDKFLEIMEYKETKNYHDQSKIINFYLSVNTACLDNLILYNDHFDIIRLCLHWIEYHSEKVIFNNDNLFYFETEFIDYYFNHDQNFNSELKSFNDFLPLVKEYIKLSNEELENMQKTT